MEASEFRTFHEIDTCIALFKGNYFSTNETYDFLNEITSMSFGFESGYDYHYHDYHHIELMLPCEKCITYELEIYPGFDSFNITSLVLGTILNSIFRDTLIDTDNPALAWQALTTSVMRMAYYDWLPTFGTFSDAKITSKVPCQVPIHSTGFSIVAANLALHLILFTVSAIWFRLATKTSLLNNAWQVVAQLKSRETGELLDHATMLTDSEVKRRIKQDHEPRRRFRIRGDRQSDGARLL